MPLLILGILILCGRSSSFQNKMRSYASDLWSSDLPQTKHFGVGFPVAARSCLFFSFSFSAFCFASFCLSLTDFSTFSAFWMLWERLLARSLWLLLGKSITASFRQLFQKTIKIMDREPIRDNLAQPQILPQNLSFFSVYAIDPGHGTQTSSKCYPSSTRWWKSRDSGASWGSAVWIWFSQKTHFCLFMGFPTHPQRSEILYRRWHPNFIRRKGNPQQVSIVSGRESASGASRFTSTVEKNLLERRCGTYLFFAISALGHARLIIHTT